MRISDWSSDVCASDLSLLRHAFFEAAEAQAVDDEGGDRGRDRPEREVQRLDDIAIAFEHALHQQDRADGEEAVLADRKSVVEGKSVSVRVDHGGRRIIKKQTITKDNKDQKTQE